MSAPVSRQRKLAGVDRVLRGAAACAGSLTEEDGSERRTVRAVTVTPEVSDYLDEIVAQAPPMSAQTRAKLAALLGRSVRRAA